MTFPPFFLKTLLLASAVAGFAFVGCGEEADTSDTTEENSDAKGEDEDEDAGQDEKDARADEDEGDDEGEAKAECEEDEVEDCDECDEPPCERRCVDEEWGECTSEDDAAEGPRDGGVFPSLPDGSVKVDEAGVTVTLGDSSVSIPTTECPDTLQCASEGMGLAGGAITSALGGASFCADPADALGLPPTCSTIDDCKMLGLMMSTCMAVPVVGSVCIQLCQ